MVGRTKRANQQEEVTASQRVTSDWGGCGNLGKIHSDHNTSNMGGVTTSTTAQLRSLSRNPPNLELIST